MGEERQTTTTDSTQGQTVTPTATAEETEFNKLALERQRAAQPGLLSLDEQGMGLVSKLLAGEDLPGYLGGLPGGISPEVTSEMAGRAVEDIAPSFQKSGILDSGTAASISARTAGDIRLGSAEFNLQNLLQLLNLGVGGQAQVQQGTSVAGGTLSSALAGLRSTSTTGTSQGTSVFAYNPFQESFKSGLGGTLSGSTFMGALGGGLGTALGTSSKRYKKDIRPWVKH